MRELQHIFIFTGVLAQASYSSYTTHRGLCREPLPPPQGRRHDTGSALRRPCCIPIGCPRHHGNKQLGGGGGRPALTLSSGPSGRRDTPIGG